VNVIHGLLSAFFPPRIEPISELVVGARAVVRGQVEARDLMDCPLAGDRCVYYHYTVEQWRESAMAGIGSGGYWTLAQRDEAIVEFYLRDETGRLIVTPHNARVERGRGMGGELVPMGVWGRRGQQMLIRPGDWIEVEGKVIAAHDIYNDERSYRQPTRSLALVADSDQPLRLRLCPAPAERRRAG